MKKNNNFVDKVSQAEMKVAELSEKVQSLHLLYDKPVFQGLKDAKESRTEINKVIEEIKETRLTPKRAFNSWYAKLESQFKSLEKEAEEMSERVKSKMDFFDAEERKARLEKVEEIITEAKIDLGYTGDIDIADNWTNKSITSKKIHEEVTALIKEKQLEETLRKQKGSAINNMAQSLGVLPDPYLRMDGELEDVLRTMKADKDKQDELERIKAEKEEAERLKKEEFERKQREVEPDPRFTDVYTDYKPEQEPEEEKPVEEELEMFTLDLFCTKSQFEYLIKLAEQNNIQVI